ncbi:MAG: hypothetical protein QOJ77_1604 [Microbacteriaceae bacterium]|jgi:hypothetical protein|nr:hypothetical protein [Microbacteriaceae bacterium]
MTLWQDQPPKTRRQARESERSEALKETGQRSRRAATVEATPAGEVPAVTTPFGVAVGRRDADSALGETSAVPGTTSPGDAGAKPSRPHLPRYQASFDTILAVESDTVDTDTDAEAPDVFGLFRREQPAEVAEPVTMPVTLVRAPTPVPVEVPTAAPVLGEAVQVPAERMIVPERTLSRRELRAMQQAQEANAEAAGQAPAVEAEPTREPVFEAAPELVFPLAVAPTVEPVPVIAPITPAAPIDVAPVEIAPVDLADEADVARQPYQPPVGHWSTAGELDDENQTYDQVLSRSVGSSGSATTSNALILPSIPSAPDAMGPLTSTGEILITGSIDLPRSLGATGQHPDRYDSPDMDRMFDQAESELNSSDVAPIRASRAVSTHTSTRGVITPPKRRGGRLPVVLSITAAVLALGVVALLIVGYVFKVF